jgi:hypothetical protein
MRGWLTNDERTGSDGEGERGDRALDWVGGSPFEIARLILSTHLSAASLDSALMTSVSTPSILLSVSPAIVGMIPTPVEILFVLFILNLSANLILPATSVTSGTRANVGVLRFLEMILPHRLSPELPTSSSLDNSTVQILAVSPFPLRATFHLSRIRTRAISAPSSSPSPVRNGSPRWRCRVSSQRST